MPTYEYRCPDGHDFEKFVLRISAAQSTLECPSCGKLAERRMSAGGGLLFKGNGFYITDYGKDGKKDQRAAAKGSEGAKGEGAATGSDGAGASSAGGASTGAAPAAPAAATAAPSASSMGGSQKSDAAKPTNANPSSSTNPPKSGPAT